MTSKEAVTLISKVSEAIGKIDVLEERISHLRMNQETGFETINRRFQELDAQIKKELDVVRSEYRVISSKLTTSEVFDNTLQRELEALSKRLNGIDTSILKVIEDLKEEVSALKKKVDDLEKIKEQGTGAAKVVGFLWSAVGGGVVLGVVLLIKLLA